MLFSGSIWVVVVFRVRGMVLVLRLSRWKVYLLVVLLVVLMVSV